MSASNTHLPLRTRFGYGTAEMGLFAVEMMVRLHLMKFYTDVAGLSAGMAGLAIALAMFWDAFTDPVMGILSDRTRHAWGKRRPYILLGAIVMALGFLLTFRPPTLDSESAKFLFLLISYIVLNTAMTILAVPHSALGGELSFDSNVRTSVFAFRLFFGNLGLLAGTILPVVFLEIASPNTRAAMMDAEEATSAYFFAAVCVSGIVLVTGLVSFFATRGMDRPAQWRPPLRGQELVREVTSLFQVLRNRVFVFLLVPYFIAYVGVSINSTLALYYYEYRLKLPDDSVGLILVVFILVWSISLAFWTLLSRKAGKKYPGFAGVFLLGLATCIAYPLFPPGQLLYPMIMAVVGGFLVGAIVLLDSLVADIVDYDELKTGQHREGLYFGFWKMAIKASRGVSMAVTGLLLSWIGFIPNQPQSDLVSERIALLFGPGVGLFFLLAALLFLFLPFSRSIHERVQALLVRKRVLRNRLPDGSGGGTHQTAAMAAGGGS
ncbi:MAG: MFS transporter [Leptospiraceae bacterium]|nr:MFS transporter [Leptospiraceae bacterium]